jgi:TonB-dependent SusC/RagA subfamily outer membrane receptor
MTPHTLHALLSLGLLVGFAVGCASRPTRREPPSAATVTAEDIEKNPGQPIEKLLQAKVPGVLITRTPDGGIAIQLRGTSSFYGSNAPLYVIDGVPIQAGPNGALTGINPYDIESIEVLKNAADTALYGMRGANGVIVVKTKRPGKPGQ